MPKHGTVMSRESAIADFPGQRLPAHDQFAPAPPEQVSERPPARSARRRSRVAVWLVVVDVIATCAAYAAMPSASWITGGVLAGVLVLNATGGRYRDPVEPALLDELPGLVGRVLVVSAIGMAAGDLVGRPLRVTAVVMFLGVACGGRLVGYVALRRLRRARQGRPTMIVGIGPAGRHVAVAMLDHPECGREPVGWIDDESTTPTELAMLPLRGRSLPWLGDLSQLPTLMASHPDWDIVVADTSADDRAVAEALQRCDRCSGEIYVLPRLHPLHGDAAMHTVSSLPLVRLRRAAHRSPAWRLKRCVDVVVAVVALVLLSPVLALCALCVYLEGGPGVIFRQVRVGLDGHRFEILKFRSLTPTTAEESAQQWSIQGDPRLGPVGRVLRTLSLDELPQLWNVLRGDMSLVGPRPERPYFVQQFSSQYPHYAARHRVPAGLTGFAQVNGLRGDTDIAERAWFDNAYITRWSLWTDVKILLRTAVGFVTRGDR